MFLKSVRAIESFDGDELSICVDDVATGVGRDCFASNVSLDLFRFFGSTGDEDNGSNAGRRDAADFFLAALAGSASCRGMDKAISLSCGKCVLLVAC